MSEELRPCPFCGGQALTSTFLDYDDLEYMPLDTIEPEVTCENERCINGWWLSPNDWNTRPIEDALNASIAELEAELKITDELLKEATETIGAVIACCTYNSNDDAKIGIYGIDQKAFTRIDQFITHYNDAVSAGKVSVDVKTSTDNNKRE